MELDSLWQQAIASALAPPRECGAPAFRAHARAKTVLTFARPFRWLISAFHKAEKSARRELRAVTLGWGRALSMWSAREDVDLRCRSEDAVISRVASALDFWN